MADNKNDDKNDKQGNVFALRGDGPLHAHAFIDECLANGATGVVVGVVGEADDPLSDRIAIRLYGRGPCSALTLIGELITRRGVDMFMDGVSPEDEEDEDET
jgi:hypothetical protein